MATAWEGDTGDYARLHIVAGADLFAKVIAGKFSSGNTLVVIGEESFALVTAADLDDRWFVRRWARVPGSWFRRGDLAFITPRRGRSAEIGPGVEILFARVNIERDRFSGGGVICTRRGPVIERR